MLRFACRPLLSRYIMRCKFNRPRSATMISLKRLSLFHLVILLGAVCWGHALGQTPPLQIKPVRPSQKASVMQTIGVTDITITYSRPGVKSRTIFADAPPSMAARATGEGTLDDQTKRQAGEPITP